jgi:hypothetical protein
MYNHYINNAIGEENDVGAYRTAREWFMVIES